MTKDTQIRKNDEGQFAIPCQVKMSVHCIHMGEYCDSEEEAREWVEEECWIFSGEGYICPPCNEQIIQNI
ncbi:MAG: hypothetical protein GWM98_29135, partial [Nitrospinaceae bacterium]|nr:hypothetical protein [Nitrospinaceae bacterium]NIR57772.1 hypothetical protein [Nitrospinaceae bacterium]NIS88234.1 hypothetical protein [Nitrospinaceae bacterium]NIT85114.1 hypothetical protein [Nitrospinaceae bacterium]NIU47271.1 hypothetical protein [Nitrospinaceae bacterium]